MIKRSFTQADLGGAGQTVLPSLAPGGVYCIVLSGFVTNNGGGTGVGGLVVECTDADGYAVSAATHFLPSAVEQPGPAHLVTTVQHPSDITVRIISVAGASGNFDVDAHVYVARARDEGND